MAFTFAAFCYLFGLIAIAFCIFFAIYTVICIDELRTDYKNPIDQCRSMNQVFYILTLLNFHFFGACAARVWHSLLCIFLFVLSMQLVAIAFNLPLFAYHIHRYLKRPIMRGPGIYDPTTIMNHDQLSKINREGWIKMGFYLLSFFYYLYAMIYTMVTTG